MSITYRPPFDEDDERDLRALYRKPGPGTSPELDAAVRRIWHPGHSWHPGWGAAACAAMVLGLFAWTDMREAADLPDHDAQLIATQESEDSPERDTEPQTVQPDASAPAILRVAAPMAAPPADPAAGQAAANAPASQEAPETVAADAAQAQAVPAEVVAYTEQDIEARVAQIRTLIVDDREGEAVQALRELQQGAPDLALPDDLQELARQHPL